MKKRKKDKLVEENDEKYRGGGRNDTLLKLRVLRAEFDRKLTNEEAETSTHKKIKSYLYGATRGGKRQRDNFTEKNCYFVINFKNCNVLFVC